MKRKNKKTGIQAYVWYLASGYCNGSESKGMYSFFYLTDSYAEAYNKALEDFEAYRLIRTRNPTSSHYQLDYEIRSIDLEERILD